MARDPKTKALRVRCTQEFRLQVDALADRLRTTPSDLVREALEDLLKRKGAQPKEAA